MDDNYTSKSVICNEFDYSNIVPNIETVSYLVKYCDQVFKQLTKLVEEDEEKNKQFKIDYKEWKYKKSYGQNFEIYIRQKNYGIITCNDYSQFMSAVNGGNLNAIGSMDIKLCLDFFRGTGDNVVEHENSFIMRFNPYEITFTRKSNYEDTSMDKIEDQLNSIFKQFPVANSIFCNKQN
jgi:hypothetical protein